MNWTLEVVVVPVSDVDRAKAFYARQLGFNVDHDTKVGEGQRIVQLTQQARRTWPAPWRGLSLCFPLVSLCFPLVRLHRAAFL